MDKGKEMMYPSVDWMKEKYDEFNQQIFNGKLPWCNFGIMTNGKGSEGNWLGSFSFDARIMVDRMTRRMSAWVNGHYVKLDETTIEDVNPTIKLNGHYKATEEAWEDTLVHEMCHYATYYQGYAPKQGHGVEFRQVGEYVSRKSKGRFTIQRLATSEEMQNFELDDEFKAKKARREANKKARILPLLIYLYDGGIRLVYATSQALVQKIINIEQKSYRASKIVLVKDPNFIDKAFADGYKTISRTYKYWLLQLGDPLLDGIDESNTETLWQDMNENVIRKVIMETISEFLERESDTVEITPDMNLGIKSPLESE